MAISRRHAVGRSRWWVAPLIALGLLTTALSLVAGLITFRVANLVITPPRVRREDVRVVSVDRKAGTITLSDHVDAIVPGRYSVIFASDTGHATVGDIVRQGDGTVTRRLLSEDSGRVQAGIRVRISGWFYRTPHDLGLAYEEVYVRTSLGPAAAWLVEPQTRSGRWVIQVHGRAVDRTETLRALPVFRASGYTSLLISYRNDGVAPRSDDGRYALGDVEWLDAEAAIEYAINHGATDIILMGWSMGGAIVMQAATRTRYAYAVRGIVLDSPVVDWVTVLHHQARAMRIPGFIRQAALAAISRPWGRVLTRQSTSIDLPRLDFVRRGSELGLPILLMHSDGDTFVPSAASKALAQQRPDIVTFESFAGAGHTRLWNYDPARWNGAISLWLLAQQPAIEHTKSVSRQSEAEQAGGDAAPMLGDRKGA
ncbi:MAG: alpha/beta hydrolase [Homoserinimonas sp.]|nr:alpha/beta hydrolase [Homoserinimonas sp.]